jgi:CubicO group peptidase (beta-lactamase class C family)
MIEVRGSVEPGFENVRAEFAAFLAEQTADPGAQLAAYADGRLVVDLYGGDDLTGDTLTGVFSITKGATHIVVAQLVQEGVLVLDKPVATLPFPLTLRELLGHRSGLIGVDGGFTVAELADAQVLAARLHQQRPFWAPGTAYGYHALVLGSLIDAEVRRVTGRSIQQVFTERLGGDDLHLGLPADQEPRYRPVLHGTEAGPAADPASLMAIAFNTSVDLVDLANDRRARALGQASAGGIGNARGVARLYAEAMRTLDGATITEFATPYSLGTDLVTGEIDHFALGFETVAHRFGFLGERAFGHGGAAGSMGWADPDTGVAYGYVRRRMSYPGPENQRLGAAVIRARELLLP